MMYTRKLSRIALCSLLSLSVMIQAAVDDITGDTGTAQTGSLTITGGSSGASFNTASSTVTQSFNYISLPVTTSTNGQILIDNQPVFHMYAPGNQNLFVGEGAGNFSTSGTENTGCGSGALAAITSGTQNSGFGDAALINLTTGNGNTAAGENAGGSLTTGGDNILVGLGAGSAYTTESSNIILGANPGAAQESNTIRIGGGTMQTACYIDGIYDAEIDTTSGLPVFVDSDGKLGTIVSTAKVKCDIEDIGTDSKNILKLRPVSFCLISDPSKTKQYGLVAQEVYEIFPDLVVKDKNGNPYAVRYHQLPVLLLNELQIEVQKVAKLKDRVKDLEERLAKLEKHCCN